jgi:hypothetical protein
MGQSATLYRIAPKDFPAIEANPDGFDLESIIKELATFDKTFEGLRFILSKAQDDTTEDLAEQIFYPDTFAGEETDFENLDIDNIPEDFSFESNAVYYNTPDKVAAISAFLDTISNEEFIELFDADELNENDIYPGGIWNTETNPDIVFNANDMVKEFQVLQDFYSKAASEGDYILSVVG